MTTGGHFNRRAARLVTALCVAIWAAPAGPGGCASEPAPTDDPLSIVQNPEFSPARRAEAVPAAWADAEVGKTGRAGVRSDFKALAWSPQTPLPLRLAVLSALLGDQSEDGLADSRAMTRLMLPHETNPEVIAVLSDAAAKGGWEEATSALVRSLSRAKPGVRDEQRPEYLALESLHPGTPVARTAYSVFLNPRAEQKTYGVDTVMRTRAAAWDLLARLDADGSLRTTLISGGEQAPEDAPAESRRVAEDLRACLADLRTIPLTGEELVWLVALRDLRQPGHDAWWKETAAAISRLDPAVTGPLRIRYAEPIRWTSRHRTDWIAASRADLLREAESRLKGRTVHRRVGGVFENQKRLDERLSDWAGQISWGDLLALLVIDEAVHDRAVVAALFAQALMDRRDTGTEYGGLLLAVERGGGGAAEATQGFQVTLYPPRPATRKGDQQFVASEDMVRQGGHSLAHYHFHAQSARNAEYAGPSGGDLEYAARSGRTCVVFTPIAEERMDADLYQPDGAIIDLGELVEAVER